MSALQSPASRGIASLQRAHELYAALMTAGLNVYVDGDKLMVAPTEKLTANQTAAIRIDRDALYALARGPIWLRWSDGKIGQRVPCLDKAGWPEGVEWWSTEADDNWRPCRPAGKSVANPLYNLTAFGLLTSRGFVLEMAGDTLMVSPTEQIDQEVADFIRANRAEIVAEVRAKVEKPEEGVAA